MRARAGARAGVGVRSRTERSTMFHERKVEMPQKLIMKVLVRVRVKGER